MEYLHRLGRSLMLPVSVMPIAAILKGMGYWLDPVGFGANSALAAFLLESGGAIIDNLPLLFAIGVAIGMTKNKDTMVVMSTIVSYLIIERLLSANTVALLMNIPVEEVSNSFESTPNALMGIGIGLLSSHIFLKYSHIELPKAFSFFGGKRFPIIVSALGSLLLGLLFILIWPIAYNIILSFAKGIASLGALGAGLYAFFNRLLVPIGLHHALNSVFWFDVAGINDIGKFWGTVVGGVVGETGMYQAGFFPIMMFGLPGAALAIYQCARSEKKKQVGAVMFSAAIASFLTGVTEPIEFSFMFVAPVLYMIHAVITAVIVYVAAAMKWLAGFGFSAGMIDFLLSIKSPFATNIWMLIPLGIFCFALYYYLFKFLILRFNFMTPGREIDDENLDIVLSDSNLTIDSRDYDELAIFFVEALGGRENILTADSCITRLRVQVKDSSLVDEKKILSTGLSGIVRAGKNHFQLVIGTQVDYIVDSINDIIR